MKIEVIKPEEQSVEIKYPCLKISNIGQIVLFTEPRIGIILEKGISQCFIGEFCDSWAEENFQPLPSGTKIVITV